MSSSHSSAGHSAAHASAGHGHDDHAHGHEHGHVVSPWLLLGVLIVLLVLTWLTVAAITVDLGALNIWIAMFIAVIKATLVVMYFMHLRWDRAFNTIIFIAALAFVALFIGLSILDGKATQHSIDTYRAADPTQYAPLMSERKP